MPLPKEVVAAHVCEKMGWTLEQYDETPVWFIRTLMMKWAADNEYHKKQLQVE